MAQGPSDTILVAIRITLRIRESKVRNPDHPDRRRFVLLLKMCALSQKFSQYLKVGGDSSALVRILEKIEGHLRVSGTRFMSGDSLTRADCYVLPSLQHIRVAGKVC